MSLYCLYSILNDFNCFIIICIKLKTQKKCIKIASARWMGIQFSTSSYYGT